MTPPHIELIGGRVSYGPRSVLEGIDFHIAAGEFVVLLGGNGSGKTTLVRTLLGLVGLRAGTLKLFGTPVARFKEWGRIGYVPQRATAAAGVPASVMEVVLSGRLGRSRWFGPHSATDKKAALRALEVVDLAERGPDPVDVLSGGQQQRVLIARALAGDPDVLVLDEPVSGVDLEHQESFAQTLSSLSARGRSVLLVAHSLGVIEPLATRAVVVAGGRIVFDGPPAKELHDSHVHHHPHSIEQEQIRHPSGGPQ